MEPPGTHSQVGTLHAHNTCISTDHERASTRDLQDDGPIAALSHVLSSSNHVSFCLFNKDVSTT